MFFLSVCLCCNCLHGDMMRLITADWAAPSPLDLRDRVLLTKTLNVHTTTNSDLISCSASSECQGYKHYRDVWLYELFMRKTFPFLFGTGRKICLSFLLKKVSFEPPVVKMSVTETTACFWTLVSSWGRKDFNLFHMCTEALRDKWEVFVF